MIKVLIVDDHHMVRKGLTMFLSTQKDIDIVGEAVNGEEAIEKAMNLQPDVILMDLIMPIINGAEATKVIKEKISEVHIIMLTSFADEDHVIPALEAGASGYQLKDIEPDELVLTIRNVMNGNHQLHPKVTSHVMTHLSGNRNKQESLLQTLTNRETEVLKEIARGKSNKEIAHTLYITEKTVKTHVSNILAKLELSDRTQAALLAVKEKLV
ncbi:response regulator transcription factor [Bacillus carboniphilus]|uniref:Response regulator transcription factor n=1 Tax=Bacillus carboniphilus TaxID=86663 RepID=A0ABY9JWF3_9BACI|nr:response regulator transcription factor [Bacillus carboniphilus]WLR42750.1 response regulator transcription factor [Bacillus carboniphilus]